MTQFVEIAPELLHQILSWSDKKTLLACATVCRLIHHVSRNPLFNAISIGQHSSERLTAILEDRFPHKHIVTEITVQFNIFNQDRKKFIDFITVLRGCPQLRTLQLITRSSQQSEKEIKMINELLDDDGFSAYQVRLLGRLGSCGSNQNGYPSVLCPALTDLTVGTHWDQHHLLRPSPCSDVDAKNFQRPILHTLRIQTVPQPWSKLEQVIDVSQIQRLSLSGQVYVGVDDALEVIQACSPTLRIFSIFHTMREPVPTNRFEKPFPLLTRLILWTGYPPFPFRSWIAPMVDKLSDLAPNLCLLDFYIHLPPSDSKKTLRATFGDFREISPLFRSISSKKNFRVVRFWLWERDGTLEDQHYLEGTFKRLIYENGWDGSVAFVWRVLWTEIWPFCDDPIDRWF